MYYCYICGYETGNRLDECPQCSMENTFVKSKDEEELMIMFDDRELTNEMLKLKENDLIEYRIKFNQLKLHYEQQSKQQSSSVNQPKCPTCGSTNLSKVSTMSKAGSVFMWGLLSQKVKKTWHCNSCKYEW